MIPKHVLTHLKDYHNAKFRPLDDGGDCMSGIHGVAQGFLNEGDSDSANLILRAVGTIQSLSMALQDAIRGPNRDALRELRKVLVGIKCLGISDDNLMEFALRMLDAEIGDDRD